MALAIDDIRTDATVITGDISDYDALLRRIGDAPFVLIGEASHGTHDFYRERARITQRLIEEQGFTAVAVEADWPDALRVNRYVQGISDDLDADSALAGFRRYYGLDLYSLYTSIEQVLAYLEKVDPEAARRARYRYSAGFGMSKPCEDEAVRQLLDMQRAAGRYAHMDGQPAADETRLFLTVLDDHEPLNCGHAARAAFAANQTPTVLDDHEPLNCGHAARAAFAANQTRLAPRVRAIQGSFSAAAAARP